MKTSADLVFWQNTLSAHQAPLLRALSQRHGQRVLLVVGRGPSDDRHGLGWETLDYGSTDVVVNPDEGELASIINHTQKASAHIFSGLGAYPLVDSARRALSRGPGAPHIAVISESWDPRGLQGLARSARFLTRVRRELSTVDTLFGIGRLARSQFTRLGIDRGKVLPFAYSVDEHPPRAEQEQRSVRLIYVGALTELKNPALLLSALSRMREHRWSLTVVGQGPLRAGLERQAVKGGIKDRVSFSGTLSGLKSREAIAASDLLVLTSRYDGWGAVVSESLMSGTPALVSANAGASEVLVAPELGAAFPSGNRGALRKQLEDRTEAPLDPQIRRRVMEWAQGAISADAMARYMLARLSHPDVATEPPWIANE